MWLLLLQKWNNPYVEKAESNRKKNTTQKMNNDLKTTQTVLRKRKQWTFSISYPETAVLYSEWLLEGASIWRIRI